MKPRDMVTLIGWLWVVLGGIVFCSGFGVFVLSSVFFLPVGLVSRLDFGVVGFIVRHYRELAFCQGVWGACLAFTGFTFLWRKPWGRVAVQAECLVNIALLTTFSVSWIRMLCEITSRFIPDALAREPRISMSLDGVGWSITFIGLFVVCIVWLRRPAIRAEFSRAPFLEKG
jgi:hypothetical protein